MSLRHTRHVLLAGIATMALVACGSSLTALEPGDCIPELGVGEITDVDTVDCDQDHEVEVIAVVEIDGDGFPGDDEVQAAAEELCVVEFPDYVGRDYETSEYYLSTLVPTSESWGAGDNEATCMVGPLEGTTTGTAKDSGR